MAVPGKTPTEPTPQRVAPQRIDELMRSALPSAADQDRLLTSPGHTWIYCHNPDNWEIGSVDGKPAALPVLTMIRLQPGMNLVATQKQNQGPTQHIEAAFQNLTIRGLRVISPSEEVPAGCSPELPKLAKTRGYIVEYPARDSETSIEGTLYAERWSVPVWTPPRAPQRFRFDRATFDRWRAHLVLSGQVEAPDASVLEQLERVADSTHRRRLSASYTAETREIKLKESAAALAAVREVRTPPKAAEPAKASA